MPYADILIFLIILLSLVVGIYKGLICEVLSLGSLVLAIVAAFYLSEYPPLLFAGSMPPVADDTSFGRWDLVHSISFAVVFLVVFVIGRLLTKMVNAAVSESPLKSVNRILGAVFGFVRGAVVVLLLVIFASLTKAPSYAWWDEAKFLPPFVNGARYVITMFPSSHTLHFRFEERTEELIYEEDEQRI